MGYISATDFCTFGRSKSQHPYINRIWQKIVNKVAVLLNLFPLNYKSMVYWETRAYGIKYSCSAFCWYSC